MGVRDHHGPAPDRPGSSTTTAGTVEGKIVDSSGGVLPGVTIEMVNVATSITLNQTSRGDGTYTFNAVKPGSYLLKAAPKGFRGVSLKVVVADAINPIRKAEWAKESGAWSDLTSIDGVADSRDSGRLRQRGFDPSPATV